MLVGGWVQEEVTSFAAVDGLSLVVALFSRVEPLLFSIFALSAWILFPVAGEAVAERAVACL